MGDTTRAARLLSLMHLLERDAVLSLEDISQTLGAPVPQVTRDLETLSMCGIAPYGGGDLIPIYVDEGVVEVMGELPALTRPIRLSSAEAHALATALQAAGLGADHPLTQRLLKASAPPDTVAEQIQRVVKAEASAGDESVFTTLAAGLDQRRVVVIEYTSLADDVARRREIEPLQLLSERGAWYVEAYCREAQALRTFRTDRVSSATLLDESFPERDITPRGVALPVDELPLARIRFAPSETYSEREWPGSRMVEKAEDGSSVVDVPYAGTAWISRQVVARQGRVEVLTPQLVRDAVRELALARLADL